jgi:hypothetical protein
MVQFTRGSPPSAFSKGGGNQANVAPATNHVPRARSSHLSWFLRIDEDAPYETPDRTEALVWYGKFTSEQEAKREMKQCLEGNKVTRKENVKDLNGRVIGTRILAAPKQRQKPFIVIQKQGLSYWIIQSISLEVATQVAGLIEPPAYDRK